MTDTLERIELKGYITEDGKLEVDLPLGLKSVRVNVTLDVERPKNDVDQINSTNQIEKFEPMTEEEIREALTFKGLTVGEILQSGLLGSWADLNIDDPVEWLHEKRRKEQEGKDLTW